MDILQGIREREERQANALESTAATSKAGGARSAGDIYGEMQGKEKTALDSTVESSTSKPRTPEEIMQELEAEKKAKRQQAAGKVKSSLAKWENSAVNARGTADRVQDATAKVQDMADGIGDAVDRVSNAAQDLSQAASGDLSGLAEHIPGVTPGMADAAVQVYGMVFHTPAPSDESIAAYQKDQAQAKESGARTKRLPYTDSQQQQWNAQDQRRMYSNYGDMYEHGQNEMDYNLSILNAAVAVRGVVAAKVLSPVMGLRQKFLAQVGPEDTKLDINGISMDDVMGGSVDLLDVEMKEGSEDLGYINGGLGDAEGAPAAENAAQEIGDAFGKASGDAGSSFAERMERRLAQMTEALGLDSLLPDGPEAGEEAAFF